MVKSGTNWIKADDDKCSKTSLCNEIDGDNYIFLYKKFSTSCPFEPTRYWDEVLEDQPIPAGLHVKIDLDSGRKFARTENMHMEKEYQPKAVPRSKKEIDSTNSHIHESKGNQKGKCKNCKQEFKNVQLHLKTSLICK